MRQSPHHIFSRSAVREVDRRAIEDYRIPGVVLMENAARGVADLALGMLAKSPTAADTIPRVLLIAGGGNNGGDAFAAARHLHNAGVRTVTVVLKPRDSYTGDAATNLAIIDAMDLPILEPPEGGDPVRVLAVLEQAADPGVSLVIDGVFGTGLAGPVRPPFDGVIRWINDCDAPGGVLAIDIPSGLDCDTGEELGAAVRADLTATFVGFKRGFVTPVGKTVIGRVAVVDIGVPRELVAELGEPPEPM